METNAFGNIRHALTRRGGSRTVSTNGRPGDWGLDEPQTCVVCCEVHAVGTPCYQLPPSGGSMKATDAAKSAAEMDASSDPPPRRVLRAIQDGEPPRKK